MNITSNDELFMKMAISEAQKGLGFTSPNPAVGAVIVKDGKVVGRGYHKRAGDNHAEVNAIIDAGDKCKEATIYVTLEPCNHTGKTPPCTQAILKAGIKKVVIGALDPNPKVKGGGANFLLSKGIDVVTGCLEKECKKTLAPFAKFIKTELPWIRAKVASSLDGKIATKTGHSKWITNEKARGFGQTLRRYSDAILIGKNTAILDNPSLTYRGADSENKSLIRIILDTNLSCPTDLKIFSTTKNAPTIVVCKKELRKSDKKDKLEEKNVKILEVETDESNKLNLTELLKQLGKMQIQSILVEGGATLHGSFWDSGLVDEAFFFFAPIIIGGKDAPTSILGSGAEKVQDAKRLKDIELKWFDDNYLITGFITDLDTFWS